LVRHGIGRVPVPELIFRVELNLTIHAQGAIGDGGPEPALVEWVVVGKNNTRQRHDGFVQGIEINRELGGMSMACAWAIFLKEHVA
jgi:hypothetical protein